MEIVEQQINGGKKGGFKKTMKSVFGNKGRKIMLLTGLLALLVVTGYLNFRLNQKVVNVGGDLNAGSEQTNLFKMFKDNRVDARTSRQMILEDLYNSSATSAEDKATARAQLEALAAEIAFETTAESSILMQCGFADIVVSKSDANINVLVKSNEVLQQEQVNKICEILATTANKGRFDTDFLSHIFISEIE